MSVYVYMNESVCVCVFYETKQMVINERVVTIVVFLSEQNSTANHYLVIEEGDT